MPEPWTLEVVSKEYKEVAEGRKDTIMQLILISKIKDMELWLIKKLILYNII